MFTGFPLVGFAGTPFGSPKPPVWVFCGGAAMVGAAELPVENKLVATSRLGIAGATGTGIALAASSILGATGASSAGTWRLIWGGGTWIASTSGTTGSATIGLITR